MVTTTLTKKNKTSTIMQPKTTRTTPTLPIPVIATTVTKPTRRKGKGKQRCSLRRQERGPQTTWQTDQLRDSIIDQPTTSDSEISILTNDGTTIPATRVDRRTQHHTCTRNRFFVTSNTTTTRHNSQHHNRKRYTKNTDLTLYPPSPCELHQE